MKRRIVDIHVTFLKQHPAYFLSVACHNQRDTIEFWL